MKWWNRLSFSSVRRAWSGVNDRLLYRRRNGLRKLMREVNACEYEDVQVMWAMLSSSSSSNSSSHTQITTPQFQPKPTVRKRSRQRYAWGIMRSVLPMHHPVACSSYQIRFFLW